VLLVQSVGDARITPPLATPFPYQFGKRFQFGLKWLAGHFWSGRECRCIHLKKFELIRSSPRTDSKIFEVFHDGMDRDFEFVRMNFERYSKFIRSFKKLKVRH